MRSNLNTTIEDETNQNNTFSENREKIKFFFENSHLKNSIREFYQVQNEFHQNMANLVNGFNEVKSLLPIEYRYLLVELLTPYRILSKNLFHEPTGDVEKDIAHIMRVINMQNDQFKKAISALLNSVSNLGTFNNLLKECQQDEELVNQIKEQLNCRSWLNVQSHVDHPFQNLLRYEFLLKTIQKHLIEGGCSPSENVLEDLESSLNYLVPEVKNINDCREIIVLLNSIDRVLGNLLANAKLKEEDLNNEKTNSISLKDQIESVMICVKTGKTNIIQGKQDILSLYEGLLELLKDVLNNYSETIEAKSKYSLTDTATAVASKGFYILSLPMSLFGAKDNQRFKPLDPLSELRAIIKELKDTLEQTEALKAIQEKLLKNPK